MPADLADSGARRRQNNHDQSGEAARPGTKIPLRALLGHPKGSATTYDVLMENGVAVAFNHKGMWTEMDAKVGSVPQSAIPADILQYARDRFPGCEVQAAKRDGKNTEIKLSNRTELMFNAKGEPIDREKEPRDD